MLNSSCFYCNELKIIALDQARLWGVYSTIISHPFDNYKVLFCTVVTVLILLNKITFIPILSGYFENINCADFLAALGKNWPTFFQHMVTLGPHLSLTFGKFEHNMFLITILIIDLLESLDSVTRFGNLLDFGQLFKAFGNY